MERFNVTWSDHSTVLIKEISRKLLQQQLVDVVLHCEGRSIKCHRLVLAAFSTYFDQIICQHPTPNMVIVVDQVKLWELEALVDFMYKGEITMMSQQRLVQLGRAAEKLKIKGLVQNAGVVDAAGPSASATMDSEHKNMANLLHYGSSAPTRQEFVPKGQQPQLMVRSKPLLSSQKSKEINRSWTSPPKQLKVSNVGKQSRAGVPLTNLKTSAMKLDQFRNQGSVKKVNQGGKAGNAVGAVGIGSSPQGKAANDSYPVPAMNRESTGEAQVRATVADIMANHQVKRKKVDENATSMEVNGGDSSVRAMQIQSEPPLSYAERKIKLEAAAKKALEYRNVKRAAAELDIPRTTLINYIKRRPNDQLPQVSNQSLLYCGPLESDNFSANLLVQAHYDVGGEGSSQHSMKFQFSNDSLPGNDRMGTGTSDK